MIQKSYDFSHVIFQMAYNLSFYEYKATPLQQRKRERKLAWKILQWIPPLNENRGIFLNWSAS